MFRGSTDSTPPPASEAKHGEALAGNQYLNEGAEAMAAGLHVQRHPAVPCEALGVTQPAGMPFLVKDPWRFRGSGWTEWRGRMPGLEQKPLKLLVSHGGPCFHTRTRMTSRNV